MVDFDAGSDELLAFLRARRWFGDKGREIASARIRDSIGVDIPGSEMSYAVARAVVEGPGGASTYQLFLRGGLLDDALEDETFRRGMVNAFTTGASFGTPGAQWIIESEGATSLVVPNASPVTLSTAEQSNSSLRIDSEAILKLYRKLEPGVHPDVEVTRFLTIARRFPHVPVLLGTIRFEDADGTTTAGMLQELVPGAMDGWAYALQCSRDYFAGQTPPAAPLPFIGDSESLGRVTRAMHEALASGDPGSGFDTRPASAADVSTWTSGVKRTMERAMSSLERAIDCGDGFPADRAEEARSLIARASGHAEWIRRFAGAIGSDLGAMTRTHGDYHLGQVLRSATARFLVIDFEGEPARPLRERRARHSPLRDVAGMLRSFAYAAAAGAAGAAGARTTVGTAEVHAESWERGAREAFLRGYFAEPGETRGFLPRTREHADLIIALFEAEKVFYELQYELDHRPEWVWIPLRGTRRFHA